MAGFPFYDPCGEESKLDPELEAFLNAGEAPIVFTLGTAAVMAAGDFYVHSAQAAQKLDKRALLLMGQGLGNKPANLPRNIMAFDYAPYSLVFPRAMAVVHQGVIGTTAQVLWSGHPMLVIPYGFDQPDNAASVVRLGVARTIARPRYKAALAMRELEVLLTNERYTKQATAIGRQLQANNGAAKACDAMEAHLIDKSVKLGTNIEASRQLNLTQNFSLRRPG